MRSVNIAELKNRLSTYIAYARAGETIIIRDRNKPVAQLVPLPLEEGITQEDRDLGCRRHHAVAGRAPGPKGVSGHAQTAGER